MAKQGYFKECLECQERFEPTRMDQKYCSPNCKNTYNNRNTLQQYHERKHEDMITNSVNKILQRNRQILTKYIDKEVALLVIEKEGFVTGFITGFFEGKKEITHFICYDVSYQFITEEYLIVSRYKNTTHE